MSPLRLSAGAMSPIPTLTLTFNLTPTHNAHSRHISLPLLSSHTTAQDAHAHLPTPPPSTVRPAHGWPSPAEKKAPVNQVAAWDSARRSSTHPSHQQGPTEESPRPPRSKPTKAQPAKTTLHPCRSIPLLSALSAVNERTSERTLIARCCRSAPTPRPPSAPPPYITDREPSPPAKTPQKHTTSLFAFLHSLDPVAILSSCLLLTFFTSLGIFTILATLTSCALTQPSTRSARNNGTIDAPSPPP
ncbi:hypothetical protein AK830_g1008 [Neonectria ditissima]|uniref:Uncharacterized protein n=1 Tax=Neonectria ditissima TaxID=78410 RepID=A0A0P7BVX2_9HYPO|nr:hypothetical protein AK830_g1008 [Neonectria ditissima]